MSKTLTEIVVDKLNQEGIATMRAYPGGKMHAIDNVFAAVGLKDLNPAAGTETITVFVVVPARENASVCEDRGLRVCRLLAEIGGNCRQGEVSYDTRGDYLCVTIEAVFAGYETIVGWDPANPNPTFTVKVENVVFEDVVSFHGEYSLMETEQAQARWTFRVEERIPLNRQENRFPQEPFSIAVVKEFSSEAYSGCRITGWKRQFQEDCLLRIWEGTATGMVMVI